MIVSGQSVKSFSMDIHQQKVVHRMFYGGTHQQTVEVVSIVIKRVGCYFSRASLLGNSSSHSLIIDFPETNDPRQIAFQVIFEFGKIGSNSKVLTN